MKFAAQRIRLVPTKTQEEYFRKACGTARFAYNWGLAEWDRAYKTGEKPTWMGILKRLRAIQDAEFPWMREVSKLAAEQAIQNLGEAFARWFRSLKGGPKSGRPKFKKKGVGRDSYLAAVTKTKESSVEVDGKRVRLACLGWVKMKRSVRFTGRISRAVISRDADHWYVTLMIYTPDIRPVPAKAKRAAVGVDLGVSTYVTTFDGRRVEKTTGPNAYRRGLSKLRRLNKSLHRKVLGSRNREKARRRLARLYYRMRCARLDAAHKLTARLARGFRTVVVEGLEVSKMLKNGKLAMYIADQGFAKFRRLLEYKCDWYGSELVVASPKFPSTKLCSKCGYKSERIPLRIRSWCCPWCSTIHDRDGNAARNLRKLAAERAVTAG